MLPPKGKRAGFSYFLFSFPTKVLCYEVIFVRLTPDLLNLPEALLDEPPENLERLRSSTAKAVRHLLPVPLETGGGFVPDEAGECVARLRLRLQDQARRGALRDMTLGPAPPLGVAPSYPYGLDGRDLDQFPLDLPRNRWRNPQEGVVPREGGELSFCVSRRGAILLMLW